MQSEAPTTVKLGMNRQVVIPKKLHDRLGLESGDYLEVEEQQGRVVMTPKTLIDRRLHEVFRESMEDFKSGRYSGPFDTAEQATASLHRIAGGAPRGEDEPCQHPTKRLYSLRVDAEGFSRKVDRDPLAATGTLNGVAGFVNGKPQRRRYAALDLTLTLPARRGNHYVASVGRHVLNLSLLTVSSGDAVICCEMLVECPDTDSAARVKSAGALPRLDDREVYHTFTTHRGIRKTVQPFHQLLSVGQGQQRPRRPSSECLPHSIPEQLRAASPLTTIGNVGNVIAGLEDRAHR